MTLNGEGLEKGVFMEDVARLLVLAGLTLQVIAVILDMLG